MIGNNAQRNMREGRISADGTRGGFTILYSLLIISLLISISLGIFDIALRDFALAQSAADSQVALFAADAGMECALYYDLKFRGGNLAFATSTVNPQTSLIPAFSYACGIMPMLNTVTFPSNNTAITTLTVYLTIQSGVATPDTEGPCAIVAILKNDSGNSTTIDSRGYNICANSTGSTKRVERGLRASY
ncbi:MAG: hypothetical protein WCO79_00860 [bacterium]